MAKEIIEESTTSDILRKLNSFQLFSPSSARCLRCQSEVLFQDASTATPLMATGNNLIAIQLLLYKIEMQTGTCCHLKNDRSIDSGGVILVFGRANERNKSHEQGIVCRRVAYFGRFLHNTCQWYIEEQKSANGLPSAELII